MNKPTKSLDEAIEMFENDHYDDIFDIFYYNAAYLKNDEAQYFLGILYHDGLGIDKDIEQALYWWKKSSKQRNEDANFMLQTYESSTFCRC